MTETKVCIKCKKDLLTTDFYYNKSWEDEQCLDIWCRHCANKHVIDAVTMQAYCRINKRIYQPGLWVFCEGKVRERLGEDTKRLVFLREVCTLYFNKMNDAIYYKFDRRIKKKDDPITAQEKEVFRKAIETTQKTWNDVWQGYYSDDELLYLEEYYNGLYNDFKLENQSYIDYARKVSKASLAMDKAFQEMMKGEKDAAKKYSDLHKIFDQLSTSAKFSEKTRSEHDTVGLGSLGDVIKKLETSGYLQKPITFEKDDIDRIIEDFRWILTSISGEEI